MTSEQEKLKRPSVMERITEAWESSDLSLKLDRRGDADWLLAVGTASIKVNPAANALMRLHYCRDKASWDDAVAAAVREYRRIAVKSGVSPTFKTARHVSILAVGYFVNPVCGACHGTCYELIPGTRRLGNRVCGHCHGTGRRPMPVRHGKHVNLLVRHLLGLEMKLALRVGVKMREPLIEA